MRHLIGCVFMLFSTAFTTAEDRLTIAVDVVNADVVFMRHAFAPGFGDPANFALDDCNAQRNLDSVGRQQALALGAELRQSKTFFTEFLSSEWCRCKETTELTNLQEWTTFSGLNFSISAELSHYNVDANDYITAIHSGSDKSPKLSGRIDLKRSPIPHLRRGQERGLEGKWIWVQDTLVNVKKG